MMRRVYGIIAQHQSADVLGEWMHEWKSMEESKKDGKKKTMEPRPSNYPPPGYETPRRMQGSRSLIWSRLTEAESQRPEQGGEGGDALVPSLGFVLSAREGVFCPGVCLLVVRKPGLEQL